MNHEKLITLYTVNC